MERLSYNLYCSREHPPLEKTAAMLAEAGYKEVEGFGGVYADPGATAATLESAGLAMPCGHFGIDDLEKDFNGCLEVARTLGMKTIYSPYLPEEARPTEPAGWDDLGARLARLHDKASEAGFAFGWHNHDFEFHKLADGSVPMDRILAAGDKIEWEADIAWIVKGGADPLDYIDRYRDRITAVHIKDIAPEGQCVDEDGWADIGKGTMDWPGLLNALAQCPIRYHIVEHDKPSDDARFAKASAEFLLAL